jgi:hypothetical protein
MMPIFLQRSNGTVLGTTLSAFWGSKFSCQHSAASLQLKPCHPEAASAAEGPMHFQIKANCKPLNRKAES